MKLSELKQKLSKKKHPLGLNLFVSEDLYLLKESEAVFSKFVETVYNDADSVVHFADQLDPEALSDDLYSLSLFSDFKFIKIKNADSLNEKSLELLISAFEENKNDKICGALFFKKIDKRKKLFKELIKSSELFELKAPYENQMSKWIMDLAKEKNMILTAGASETLYHLVGDSLTDISEGLESLKSIYGKSKITSELVNETVSLKRDNNVFKICDYMGLGDFTAASLEIDLSLKAKSSSVGILHLLLRHFNILIKIKKNAATSVADLAKLVGVPHYFLKNYQSQARSWSKEKLMKTWSILLETDEQLKSANLKEETLMANMLIQITAVYGEINQ